MIRVSLPWMIDVANSLDQLDEIKVGETTLDNIMPLVGVRQQMEALFNQSVYAHFLRTSREKANELYNALGELFNDDHFDEPMSDVTASSLKLKRDHFKLVFLSEISTLPVFLVTRKENFDVTLLIEQGVNLFPPSLLDRAPETELDAAEVGKALAFELGTACGFHAFRVTEAIVKRYWDEASSGKPRPKLETIGNYAAEMEKAKIGDPKIIESLKQMTRLHRNPLIHPEVILSVDEAIGIIGIARSVIGAMLAVLPDVPLTTGAT